jgi:hypothetical protein
VSRTVADEVAGDEDQGGNETREEQAPPVVRPFDVRVGHYGTEACEITREKPENESVVSSTIELGVRRTATAIEPAAFGRMCRR